MIEIPEAAVIARQLNKSLSGKTVDRVTAAQSPHKFAWYSGDPKGYSLFLKDKVCGEAFCHGGMVEITFDDKALLFTDGVNLRYHPVKYDYPAKHQLLVEFEDGSSLSSSVAMYGGLWCFVRGTYNNQYYLVASQKPSPLTDRFNESYFAGLFQPDIDKYSLKAFLATEQRIPGLGNGVLQDILYNARMHPKRKVFTLKGDDKETLYHSVVYILRKMEKQGGRDTERDLFGNPGGYATCMSKNTVGKPCPICGSLVKKQPYIGGSIYFCPCCQKED
jgi:formamidopyrimidine-DNA glycosylase